MSVRNTRQVPSAVLDTRPVIAKGNSESSYRFGDQGKSFNEPADVQNARVIADAQSRAASDAGN